MNKKVYRRLMIARLVPWRADLLKKQRPRVTEADRLLRDGWQYVNIDKTLTWKGRSWKLFFKVVDDRPRPLPGFEPVEEESLSRYCYVEFVAVNTDDHHAELYAYGNLVRGSDKPYLMRGRQLIRKTHETKSHKNYGPTQFNFDI